MAERFLPTVLEGDEGQDVEKGLLEAQKDEEQAPPGCDRCLVASYCVGVPICLGLGLGVILLFWWIMNYHK